MSNTTLIIGDASELSPSWLSEVLAGAGIDATVQEITVAPVGSGQMASCYRLGVQYRRGDAAASFVVKLPSTDPAVRAGAAMTYRTEVEFYRQLAPGLRIAVPRCYYGGITEDATAFTLLLEDVSPARAGDQLVGCGADQARDAVVAIAGLHADTWCDPALDGLDALIPRTIEFVEHTAPMLQTSVRTFIEKRDLGADTVDVLKRFADAFAAWAKSRALPYSLLHNDFRLDNLLFAPPGADIPAVTTVDWQSVSIGLPMRDVAFLVGTGLEPEVRRSHERAIVNAYHDALVTFGVHGYDADHCWDDYRYALFHGPYICLMGDTVAAPTERGQRMFTVMAERSAAAIRELDCFDVIDLEAA